VRQNLTVVTGIVSAPLWDSKSSTFAGLLTTSDYINVIQYYWQNPDALQRVDQFRLNSLRGKTCSFPNVDTTNHSQTSKRRSVLSQSKQSPSTPTAPSTKHAGRCSNRVRGASPLWTATMRRGGPWSSA
jgi:hypothetical protein